MVHDNVKLIHVSLPAHACNPKFAIMQDSSSESDIDFPAPPIVKKGEGNFYHLIMCMHMHKHICY